MSTEDIKNNSLVDNKPAIQVLFSKLTELIMLTAKSRVEITNLVVIVGNWAAIVFATLVVMLEGNDPQKAHLTVDRITISLNRDIKQKILLIRKMKDKAALLPEK